MSEYSACPIWNTPASIEPRTGHGMTVDSQRAGGRYFIADTATEILKDHDENLKARLTSWLIEQRRLGVHCPRISSIDIDEIEQRRSLSVHQRADNLLRYIQKQIPKIGIPFDCHIHETDPTFMETLAWSESTKTEEVVYLVNSLEIQGWLSPNHQAIGYLGYGITVEGYSYLAEIDHAVTDSPQAFVAMWFDESMNEVWEKGLRPAIRDAGYKALRIDRKEHLTVSEFQSSELFSETALSSQPGCPETAFYGLGRRHEVPT